MARMRTKKTVRKDLRCEECGGVNTIHRKLSRDKATGHYKHLHCIVCGRRTRHVELDRFALRNGGARDGSNS